MPRARCWRAPPKAISSSPIPGRGRCAPSTATISASWTPISPPIRANISPATAAGATPTAITGSPAASTTSSTSPATAWARPRSKCALVAHPKVSEAAVVGYPHDIKGQGIYAYVTLMAGEQPSEELRKELVAWVRKEIGPIASPDLIQFAPGLPKTRSGKIMRRILRKIAEDESGASATPRRWPIPPWSTISCTTGRTRSRHSCAAVQYQSNRRSLTCTEEDNTMRIVLLGPPGWIREKGTQAVRLAHLRDAT